MQLVHHILHIKVYASLRFFLIFFWSHLSPILLVSSFSSSSSSCLIFLLFFWSHLSPILLVSSFSSSSSSSSCLIFLLFLFHLYPILISGEETQIPEPELGVGKIERPVVPLLTLQHQGVTSFIHYLFLLSRLHYALFSTFFPIIIYVSIFFPLL